jgi:hypothetical protein
LSITTLPVLRRYSAESFFHLGSRTRHVEPHKIFSALSKLLSCADGDKALIDEKIRQRMGFQAEFGAVQPGQKGSLRTNQLYSRSLLSEENVQKVHVSFDVGNKLLQIVIALRVGGCIGRNGEDVLLNAIVLIEVQLQLLSYVRIWDDAA